MHGDSVLFASIVHKGIYRPYSQGFATICTTVKQSSHWTVWQIMIPQAAGQQANVTGWNATSVGCHRADAEHKMPPIKRCLQLAA